MFLKETQLVKEAKKSRVLLNVASVLFLAMVINVGGQGIGQLGLDVLKISVNTMHGGILKLIFYFVPSIVMLFIYVKFIEKRNIRTMGLYKKEFIKKYLKGFMIGMASFTSVVLLLAITGHIKIVEVFNPEKIVIFLILLPGWIIQTASEEIVARGWAMNALGAKYNITTGLIVSSLFFSSMHLLNPGTTYLSSINIFIAGIWLGLYAIKTENLWGVCGLHAAWNAFQANFFGFKVSGVDRHMESIMQLKTVGSDIITGGAFGPEAGLASTIVTGLVSIFLLYKIRKSYKKVSI
ncbi:CPBP family intramembrane glutamic endopeptidase [Clostridium oceanicum]|uniref:Type II CAAX endopeptidase family protein n=1 Tax=Clostridium oceanicum TaxID=1543 RepID=A0ABP3UPU1_9CLOT